MLSYFHQNRCMIQSSFVLSRVAHSLKKDNSYSYHTATNIFDVHKICFKDQGLKDDGDPISINGTLSISGRK